MYQSVAAVLTQEQAPVFSIIDAARSRSISPMVKSSGLRYQSLYNGEAAEELGPFGPYLVEMPADAASLERWVEYGWGKSFSIYLSSRHSFDELRRHLRRLLIVELVNGRRVYFRYYDPRVLRTFLTNCTYDEWVYTFGPITAFLIETEDACSILRFDHDADEPVPERLTLPRLAPQKDL